MHAQRPIALGYGTPACKMVQKCSPPDMQWHSVQPTRRLRQLCFPGPGQAVRRQSRWELLALDVAKSL